MSLGSAEPSQSPSGPRSFGTIPVAAINFAFQGLLDAALRVDRRAVLNSGPPGVAGGAEIAAELLMAVRMMQAEATTPEGRVNYGHLRDSRAYGAYRKCTRHLVGFEPSVMTSAEERFAFWINLYNALILDAVMTFSIRGSVREDTGFFRRAAYLVGGRRYSADDIEHGILRANRRHFHPAILFPQFAPDDPRIRYSLPRVDPRIHCALVCASRSCPPYSAFDSARIDQQLDEACRAFVNSGAVTVRERGPSLCLSQIFRWYRRDFGGEAGVRDFLRRFLDAGPGRSVLESERNLLEYQPYDWSLNSA